MIEADAPSTGHVTVCSVALCPSHRGLSWSHHRRSCARQRGRKAKAAPRRGPKKRGQGHYRSLDPTPSFAAAKESYPSRGLLQRCYMSVYRG